MYYFIKDWDNEAHSAHLRLLDSGSRLSSAVEQTEIQHSWVPELSSILDLEEVTPMLVDVFEKWIYMGDFKQTVKFILLNLFDKYYSGNGWLSISVQRSRICLFL